ncbi:discoidin domain-containing protein [Paenibacillus sp. TSA_86.1]|uniref:discoidin domain-containing protein n=1 Tax=Paenibacillus sp. TSA_86.1 TaxID=3415649 RepID=UPI0040453D83
MMATVGEQIKEPEAGWRRYDDTHPCLKYTGTWTTPSPTNAGYYGGSIRVTSRAVDNNYVTFSFFGTKLRIISDFYSDRHSDNAITIDGVTEIYSAFRTVGTSSLQQAIVYEKVGLTLGFHTVSIATGHNRINYTLDAIDIDETGYLYSYALTAPESGWKRIDDSSPQVAVSGNIARNTTDSNFHNTSAIFTQDTTGQINFKFYGTKFRLIGAKNTNRSTNIEVFIDEVKDTSFSQNGALLYKSMDYEKSGLPLGTHIITIKGNGVYGLDAIDIDNTGYLLAQLGQQLTAPEPRWRRYDDSHSAFVYLGENWIYQQTGVSGLYNSTHHYSAQGLGGNEIKLKFYGTKFRLISSTGSDFADDILVTIDENTEYFSAKTGSTIALRQRLTYEKLNLPLGVHEVRLTSGTNGSWRLDLDAIDIDENGELLAQIGSQLSSPEVGWKRYDADIIPEHFGTDWKTQANETGRIFEGGSVLYTNVIGNYIKFSFTGNKIRLIAELYSTYDPSVEIELDGNKESISLVSPKRKSQTMVYERTNLVNGRHEMTIKKVIGTTNMHIDAIDIGYDGRLFHPEEVTTVTELEVGKRIRCHYQSSTANTMGFFSGLGEQTSELIPATSSATPNGDFYYIMVEDWNGRKRLVADRNIQHSISWDTLNMSGVVSGLSVSLAGPKEAVTSIRLLTGGITAADKDNEWDKYIGNSTLNDKVTAGDNNVWNYNGGASWTSTTNVAGAGNRTGRGANGNAGASGYNPSAYVAAATATGFRPMMEIVILPMYKTLINYNETYAKFSELNYSYSKQTAIPFMDSNTSPSGIAAASSIYIGASTYEPWRAFNGTSSNAADCWATESGKVTGWLAYKFTGKVSVYKYSITSRNSSVAGDYAKESAPKKWTFEGSNDGVSWTVLDTQLNVTNWSINETRIFEITESSVESFINFRLNISENNGGNSFTTVAELRMFERIIITNQGWSIISTTHPSENTFISEGMADLNVFNRKPFEFKQALSKKGSLGAGEMFSTSINLKKYIEILNLNVK